MNDQRLAIAILAGVGMLSTFMPWVKVPVLGYMVGTNYSGWITFLIFSVPFILAFIGDRVNPLTGGKLYIAICGGILAAGIGVWEIFDLESNAFFSVEYGLYLLVISGTVIPLAAFIMGNKKRLSEEMENKENPDNIAAKKSGAPD